MKLVILLRAILILLGLFLIAFGVWRIADPIGFYAFSGLLLQNEAGLLSEARGAGGLVFASGCVIAAGGIFPAMSVTSAVMSVLVFWSFAFARLVGIFVDGLPNEVVLQGLYFELLFGSVGAFALLGYRLLRGRARV